MEISGQQAGAKTRDYNYLKWKVSDLPVKIIRWNEVEGGAAWGSSPITFDQLPKTANKLSGNKVQVAIERPHFVFEPGGGLFWIEGGRLVIKRLE